MEIGVVGGEEDGVVGEMNEKLYSTPEDALAVADKLGLGERGRYLLAATFGNVHGVYKPATSSCGPRPEGHPGRGRAKYGQDKPFDLVFHGGSGSDLTDIRKAIGLRRGQDECRHRHSVRVHPPGGRPHVRQL